LQSASELGESKISAFTCTSISKSTFSVSQVVNSLMPKTITIENKNKLIDGPLHIKYCDTFFTQLRGFTLRSALSLDEGLVLVGKRDSRLDSSIHMFFVSFDLSVIWINSAMQVVDKVLAKSWRPAYFSKQPARYVLEVHPERWSDFEIGDTVEFKDA
jgi:uncharacterized membrane protein (UPF0127 family)